VQPCPPQPRRINGAPCAPLISSDTARKSAPGRRGFAPSPKISAPAATIALPCLGPRQARSMLATVRKHRVLVSELPMITRAVSSGRAGNLRHGTRGASQPSQDACGRSGRGHDAGDSLRDRTSAWVNSPTPPQAAPQHQAPQGPILDERSEIVGHCFHKPVLITANGAQRQPTLWRAKLAPSPASLSRQNWRRTMQPVPRHPLAVRTGYRTAVKHDLDGAHTLGLPFFIAQSSSVRGATTTQRSSFDRQHPKRSGFNRQQINAALRHLMREACGAVASDARHIGSRERPI